MADDLNLLFITTDQQRWDSLPCYGLDFVQAPNLERLAREGIVFDRAYTPAPLCVPMRAAMMSGLWPSTTGVLGNSHWLDSLTPTWPERFSAAGVWTGAIGKMHFHPWDARHGFQERISAEDKRHTYLPDDYSKFLRAHGHEPLHPTAKPDYFEWLQASRSPWPKRFHVDAFVGDQGADWVRQHADQRFAAWVSFPGPHDPYDPPAEMAEMYYDAPIPEPVGSREELATKPRAQRATDRMARSNVQYQLDLTKATADHFRRWRAHYYANVTLIDEGIGKILAALEERGMLDRTLIVFTSDHGDALGDHGLVYKSFFYDCMARVPLLVRGPGVAAGQRCRALVSTLDLVPLFYRAMGVEPPATLQGVDVSPLLAEPTREHREWVVSENSGAVMVRDDRFKYVQYRNGDTELYDLGSDPNELVDLAQRREFALEIGRLRGLLVEHALACQGARAVAVSRPTDPRRLALDTGRVAVRRPA